MSNFNKIVAGGVVVVVAAACSEHAMLPAGSDFGPNAMIGAPHTTLIPTVNIAPAKGWAAGATPVAASGLVVKAFASGLDHPRWLYVLPNGDVLVAESNAPKKHDAGSGLKGWLMRIVQKEAGAGVPSPNKVILLRDQDGDGVAETRSVFLEGLNSPFGMVLVGHDLYVADTDALLKFSYRRGQMQIAARGKKMMDLPAGPINHHWTKNVVASPDRGSLYVSVGSNSNVGDNSMEVEHGRAAIYEYDIASGTSRIFAYGLRNPVGMSFQPQSHRLWVCVNERDEFGSDLVPDYMTEVKEGGFYGWPYSYYGQHIDVRVNPQRPDLVAQALVPDYALGAHTAPLGLTFYSGKLLPQHYLNGAFVGQHGSWNRRPHSGYKVVFIPFSHGKPADMPKDVLTGFLDTDGNAQGRPVGVLQDRAGALLVADDVGNVIWRVTQQGL